MNVCMMCCPAAPAQAVGRVYQTEAEIFQSNPLFGGFSKLKRAGDSIK
jgi:hypothetical protein